MTPMLPLARRSKEGSVLLLRSMQETSKQYLRLATTHNNVAYDVLPMSLQCPPCSSMSLKRIHFNELTRGSPISRGHREPGRHSSIQVLKAGEWLLDPLYQDNHRLSRSL